MNAKDNLCGWFIPVTAFGLFMLTAAPAILPGGNRGELTAVAWLLGNAHPSGYPLFLTILHGWIRFLPIGDIAARANLFSAFLMAATVALFGTLLRHRYGRFPAIVGSLLLYGMPLVWQQATAVEVYPMVLLLLTALLAVLLRYRVDGDPRRLYFAIFLFGLAAGHHLLGWIALPSVIVLLPMRKKLPSFRILLITVFLLLLAFSIFAYLPVRAGKVLDLNWGDPSTLPRLWAHYRGLQFKHQMIDLAPGEFSFRLSSQLKKIPAVTGWLPLLLALPGLIRLAITDRRLTLAFLWWLTGYFLVTTLYGIGDIDEYLAPFCLAIAFIDGTLFYRVKRSPVSKPRRLRLLPVVIALTLAGVVILHWPAANRSRQYFGQDYAHNLVLGLPPSATVMLKGDNAVNAAVYLQVIERIMPSVRFIDVHGNLFHSPVPFGAHTESSLRFFELQMMGQGKLYYSFNENQQDYLGVRMRPKGLLWVPALGSRYALRERPFPNNLLRRMRGADSELTDVLNRAMLAEYNLRLADFELVKGRIENAKRLLDISERWCRGLAHLEAQRGSRWWAIGNSRQAILAYRRAVEQNPFMAVNLNNLAWYYLQSGVHLDEAERLVRQAVRLAPENEIYRRTEAEVRKARAQKEKFSDRSSS